MQMDIVTRQQLNILIHLANDGVSRQQDMIERVAIASDFPLEQLDQLKKYPEPIGSLGALSTNQKFEYLYSMVEMMIVGQVEVQKDVLFYEQLALDLGFSKRAIGLIKEEIQHASNKAVIKLKLHAAF